MRNIILTSMGKNYTQPGAFLRGKFLVGLILLAALLGCPSTVYAEEYDFSSENNTVTILYKILSEDDGTVSVAGCDDKEVREIEVPETVSNEGRNYTVTRIGEYAFNRCLRLYDVSLPNTLSEIGDYSFAQCQALEAIDLPEALTSIGDYAFSSCGLSSISIPKATTTIGEKAFAMCFSLVSVSLPESLTSIGTGTFLNCHELGSITFPESLISIGDWAFEDCRSLTEIAFPTPLETIGKEAFEGCTGLKQVSFSESLKSIGNWAFANCESLETVALPESLMSMGEYAFAGCSSLTAVKFPKSFEEIKFRSFIDCPLLKNVWLPYSCTYIGTEAFKGCSALDRITLPDDLTNIGMFAFAGTSIDFVCLPRTLMTINGSCFEGCSDICILPEGSSPYIAVNGEDGNMYSKDFTTLLYAHCNWQTLNYNMTEVQIPESVETIGEYAFHGVYDTAGLKGVYCHSKTPPHMMNSYTSIREDIYGACTLYVPTGSLDAYKNSDWGRFGNIEEMVYTEVEEMMADGGVSVAVRDGKIVVEGAEEALVEVYGLNGCVVYRGTESTVGGLPKGVYVVRVGELTRKVIL